MTVRQTLAEIRKVRIAAKGHPVEVTIAREALAYLKSGASIRKIDGPPAGPGKKELHIALVDKSWRARLSRSGVKLPLDREWVYFHVDDAGSVFLLSSQPCFLFAGFTFLVEKLLDEEGSSLRHRIRKMSFSVEKSTFDLVLTQYARIIRGFDRERYIREYARLGFTHIEVNALAAPFPYEQGVPKEFYPDFYTYCPALDQFVESRLYQGLYPKEYLDANLARLKENARLALKYGLTPGLLCFEPRSVPETLFQKFPTLRGARVDHPFRSFKPRFTLSLVHPVARKHYAELMTNLMNEVPELEFMAIWSNDSGSGFEHTKSLYVGRNGGAYMIREWKNDEEIAKAAAANIANFYRLIRDAAARVNPRFRVITRLESFYGERRYLWPELRDRLDVEINSLLVSGWENNYPHPSYPDIQVLGSAYHNQLWDSEKKSATELWSRGSRSYYYHFFNSHGNHEPLLGIPFPWLTYEKLKACARLGIRTMAHMGGLQPPDKVPYAVNQELFREFQWNAGLDIDRTVLKIARVYAGDRFAADLVAGWRLVEKAIRHFVPMSLYSGFGTVWNRLLVRPLVPDIDRIPEEERAYYENVMVSPVHNPNKVDLARDVLFELISKDYARSAYQRIDAQALKALQAAVELFTRKMREANRAHDERAEAVFKDQRVRARALGSLYETLRNTAVWIYAVHEFQETRDAVKKARCRSLLDAMIGREIANARNLIRLWHETTAEWMHVTDFGETPFIYGENFPRLLQKKIALMKKHRRDKPAIDPDYMFRVDDDPFR
ncbi:MAG: hypothetical protein ABSF88_02530 [Candidatus Aminicenantales bacterium]